MSDEIDESLQAASSSDKEDTEGSSSEGGFAADDSSDEESGSNDTDSLGALKSQRDSSAGRPKLSDFLEANRRNAPQLPATSANRSLTQEIEAKRIAPQLTSIVGKSMRDLNFALQALGLDEESLDASLRDSLRESFSSEVTDLTSLREQINAADAGRLSANSTTNLLPPEIRDLLAQKGPSAPLTPRRSLAVPPSPMMGGAVEEGDEGGSSSSGSSSPTLDPSYIMPTLVPSLESERSTQHPIIEDEAGEEENSGSEAASLGSSSSSSHKDPDKPATGSSPSMSKPSAITSATLPLEEVQDPIIDDETGDRAVGSNETASFRSSSFRSSSSNLLVDPTKASTRPPVSKLESDPTNRTPIPYVSMIICTLVIFGILFAGAGSISGKSLPPETHGKSIRNRTPEPPAEARAFISDDTLYDAFEALVGDGIHTPGSSQYFAARWILEKDPRRRRSTLERSEQRFLLACFYFKTSENCQSPWLSCNYELASSLPRTSSSRQTFIDHVDHSTSRKDVSRAAPTISERSSSPRSIQSSSCEFKQPLYGEQGEITGYETTESYRWLSGHSECSWAGIRCKYNDGDSLTVNPVVEINLEGQIHYESIVTEILQLPSLESLYY